MEGEGVASSSEGKADAADLASCKAACEELCADASHAPNAVPKICQNALARRLYAHAPDAVHTGSPAACAHSCARVHYIPQS